MKPIKVQLSTPVQHGQEEVKELVFARPMVAGDLRGISVTDLKHDDVIEIASRLVAMPPSVLRQLSMPDYMGVAEVVTSFFGSSPLTGAKP